MAVSETGEIVRPSRESRITRLEARAVRDKWGLNDTALKEIVSNLKDRVPKATARDASSITSALASLMKYSLDESKFELDKIKAEDGPKTGTTVNVGVGVNIQQSYQERVAGRDYDELCAEIAAEAASVTKRLEGR